MGKSSPVPGCDFIIPELLFPIPMDSSDDLDKLINHRFEVSFKATSCCCRLCVRREVFFSYRITRVLSKGVSSESRRDFSQGARGF